MTDRELLELLRMSLADSLATVERMLAQGTPAPWAFPVGTDLYPPQRWYAACLHDLTGKLNGGYAHTGIDLNLDVNPWGDVDRGMPVWAIADGVVYAAGYSQSYLGGVVVECQHDGLPLYVRYWHLADNTQFRLWKAGDRIFAGKCLGLIGDYKLGEGGDHCHLDMRAQPFEPHWWFTSHPGGWLDPVPILKAHLPPAEVDAMLRKGDK